MPSIRRLVDRLALTSLAAFILLGLLCLATLTSQAQPLVWEENFNGTTINLETWTFDFGDGCERGIRGWGNQELEYYTSRPENARVENGNLLIEARREDFLGKPFTQKLIYGQDANIYYWNSLSNISTPTPFEGNEVLALRAAVGNWFGFGVANEVKQMLYFSNGFLKFHMKTKEAAYGKDYKVQLSEDANNWTDVKTITDNTALVNDHTDLVGRGRYVRIDGTARGTVYGYFIFELEVYGDNGGTTPPDEYCGTAATATIVTKPLRMVQTFTFHPLAPIAGSNLALIYIQEGGDGIYPGYAMTQLPSGDFTFTKSIANGTVTSIYFTYRISENGPERNSSATPHSYTVGSSCAELPVNTPPTVAIMSPTAETTFTAPATISIQATASDNDGTFSKVAFYNGNILLGSDDSSPYSFD